MRRKPYTEKGIARVPCMRCAKPSTQQFRICAFDNKWAGVCIDCDIQLNQMVLRFMGVSDKDANDLIETYKALKE